MPSDVTTASTPPPAGLEPALEAQLGAVLRSVWGFDGFRPLQREAMAAILERRDSLVVLPTGGGKSLCFQAPALVEGEGGLGLVVSPLIALMKDQVDALRAAGVEAALLNSSLDAAARDDVMRGVRAGRFRLLYVAPERLVGEGGDGFRRELGRAGVRFVAVDEAHCISQWGHDFRPEYRRLRALREEWPQVSLHAFTATATPRVRRDIVEQLGLRQPEILVGSFDRPNLLYRVRRRADGRRQILELIRRHAGEAGIVYCISRREVEELTEFLRGQGIEALAYHAGMDDQSRRRNQEAFAEERVEVIVATVAFGMGIDRSNVRFVLHAAAPRSLEHYQQEAGRAGRDGLEAECLLLYSAADFLKWRRILEQSGELREEAQEQLRHMERYAQATGCRHKALVAHFGQAFESPSCGACDRCLGELLAVDDPLVVAQKILSCVLRVRESFGAGHVVDILRGRLTDKVRDRGHAELSTFGLLLGLGQDEVHGYVEQLIEQGFLSRDGDRLPVLRVTPEGRRLLRGEVDCDLVHQTRPEPRGRAPRSPRHDGASWEGVDPELFERLRAVRLEIARERGVPPYVICHDTTRRDLARKRPRDERELLEVHGIGARKAADLGERFLAAIRGGAA
jgi:ATP-dependent DNA helicase RecQ